MMRRGSDSPVPVIFAGNHLQASGLAAQPTGANTAVNPSGPNGNPGPSGYPVPDGNGCVRVRRQGLWSLRLPCSPGAGFPGVNCRFPVHEYPVNRNDTLEVLVCAICAKTNVGYPPTKQNTSRNNTLTSLTSALNPGIYLDFQLPETDDLLPIPHLGPDPFHMAQRGQLPF